MANKAAQPVFLSTKGLVMGEEPGGARGAVVALIVLLVLVVGDVWLSGALRGANRVQDCVMAGRTNCAPASP